MKILLQWNFPYSNELKKSLVEKTAVIVVTDIDTRKWKH